MVNFINLNAVTALLLAFSLKATQWGLQKNVITAMEISGIYQ